MAFDGELNPIKDSRFDKFEYVASGAWGSVYKAFDTRLKKEIAIKVLNPSSIAEDQMQQRKINLEEAMIKDADLITNSDHIVPRQLFEDDDGKLFLTMPFYENFLDGYLGDTPEDAQRKSVKAKSLSLDEMLSLSIDISQGLEDLHDYGRSHGDIKPDNIALKGKRGKNSALINDLGSSTLEAYGERSENPRDNIGFMYTRAPEQFKEGAHPTSQSDIWAMGSLMYRMITGDYILENEIDDIMNDRMLSNPLLALGKFMQREEEDLESIIQKRISKNASTWVGLNPFGLSKILKKSLTLDMDERYSSMEELESDLQGLVKQRSTSEVLGLAMKKFALPSLIASIPLAFAAYQFTKPPSDLSMPTETLGEYAGYMEFFIPKEQGDQEVRLLVDDKRFESLQLRAKAGFGDKVENKSEYDSDISAMTDNRLVAHIMKQYFISEQEFAWASGGMGHTTWSFGGEVERECEDRADAKREELRQTSYFPRGVPFRSVSDDTIDKRYPRFYCTYTPSKDYGAKPSIYLELLEERILDGFKHAERVEDDLRITRPYGGVEELPTRIYLEDLLAISLVGNGPVQEAKDIITNNLLNEKRIEAKFYEDLGQTLLAGYWSEEFSELDSFVGWAQELSREYLGEDLTNSIEYGVLDSFPQLWLLDNSQIDDSTRLQLQKNLVSRIDQYREHASSLRTDFGYKIDLIPHLHRREEAEFFENLVSKFDKYDRDPSGERYIFEEDQDLKNITRTLHLNGNSSVKLPWGYVPLFSEYHDLKDENGRYLLPQEQMTIVSYWASAVISNSS